ncbi:MULTISPECIES: flagellar protein FliT [Methylocaldum]|uniref:flagellar protein FliT n=1 Tax=Methylocaldum sp. RMAD-M TaxID=2806557 RepID=UPI000A31ED2F|nr:flagellar protein FliT [Methylocaldum sp. RMAD-M]MBP1151677.1 hypothetical protein [Methylocaldum sp. RMAD-M]
MSDLTPETEKLLAMCRSILTAAEGMEWERVARLERERMPLIEKLFSPANLEKSDNESLVRLVEEVQTIDGKVMSLIEAERNQAAQELRMLRNSRQREQAYRSAENE